MTTTQKTAKAGVMKLTQTQLLIVAARWWDDNRAPGVPSWAERDASDRLSMARWIELAVSGRPILGGERARSKAIAALVACLAA